VFLNAFKSSYHGYEWTKWGTKYNHHYDAKIYQADWRKIPQIHPKYFQLFICKFNNRRKKLWIILTTQEIDWAIDISSAAITASLYLPFSFITWENKM